MHNSVHPKEASPYPACTYMAKKNVKVSGFGFAGMGIVAQNATQKAEYVCPVSREDFNEHFCSLFLHVGGITVELTKRPVVDGESLGWSSPSELVNLGDGVLGRISPFGVWVNNSTSMDKTVYDGLNATVVATITTDKDGKHPIWTGEFKKTRSKGGSVGWVLGGKSASFVGYVAKFGDIEAKLTANPQGFFLNKSKG